MRVSGPRAFGLAAALALLAAYAPAQAPGVQTSAQNGSGVDPITAEGYLMPPPEIARLVLAPRDSYVNYGAPSPVTRRWFSRTISDVMPPLKYVGAPHHNLAGWQVDQFGNRQRSMTMRSAIGYELFDWAAGKKTRIEVPNGARVWGGVNWSPDGMTAAFLVLFDTATHIYLADPTTGRSRPLTRTSLLATNVTNFEWTADGRSIIAVLVPDGRGPEPKRPPVETTPWVRVNENTVLKTRTFADLLEDPTDKALLRYHSTGQLALIDVRSRAVKKIGAPGMIRSLSPSPDGKYFRVTYTDEPFSYVVQTNSFGTTEVIVDETGKVLKRLAQRPLREGEAIDDPDDPPQNVGGGRGGRGGGAGSDTAKRNLTWHPFEPGLMFMRSAIKDSASMARDDSIAADAASRGRGGRANAAGAGRGGAGGRGAAGGRGGEAPQQGGAQRPDTLFLWSPPFAGDFRPLYTTGGNGTINSVQFNETGRVMFVTQTVGGTTTTDAIYLDENNARYTVVRGGGGGGAAGGRGGRGGRGGGGGGGGGGGLMTTTGNRGQTVVLTSSDGRYVYTMQAPPAQGGRGRGGRGAAAPDSNAGPTPDFIDRIEIKTGQRSRVYQSDNSTLTENIVAPLDADMTKLLITRESRTTPRQSYILDVATREARQITNNRDLMPEIRNVVTKEVMAKRADGYTFRVRVTLPHDYREGSNPRYPAMFWFYPREYDDQADYNDQVLNGRGGGPGGRNNGPGTFPNPAGVRSMSFLTAIGYAVVEPDSPIFGGDGYLPNDNYVVDLRNNLAATIDALDTLGIIDRHRLAIGGHSYGAFSTANAMVHTPFFKAGIAGDGMYNRTLTPNGFQSERRDFWQAKDVYLEMSPMLFANRMTGALLMYHGAEDQNVGTNRISSERMYHALMGQGKNVALYMYPYEDHGPIAAETVLDQWARWVAWLDKYVKGAKATVQ